MRKTMISFCLLMAAALSSVYGVTVDVPLTNPSFENNYYTTADIYREMWWLEGQGSIGIIEPDLDFMDDNYSGQSLPDGNRVLALGGRGKSPCALKYILPITEPNSMLEPDTTYTLQFDIGNRSSDSFDGYWDYIIAGLYSYVSWGPALDELRTDDYDTDIDPVPGQFTTYTLNFTTGNGQAGDPYLDFIDIDELGDPNDYEGISSSAYGKPVIFYIYYPGDQPAVDIDNIRMTKQNSSIQASAVTIAVSPSIGINTINIPEGTYDVDADQPLELSAKMFVDCPEYYAFDHWEKDSVTVSSQFDETFVVDSSCGITAVFDSVPGSCQHFEDSNSIIPIANSDFEMTTPESTGWVNVYENISNGLEWGEYQAGWFTNNIWWSPDAIGQTLAFRGESNYVTDVFFPGVSLSPYGDQVAWLAGSGGYAQTLPDVFLPGTYTIEFDLGRTEDNWCRFHLQLYAGSRTNLMAEAEYRTLDNTTTDNDLSNNYGLVGVPVHDWVHQRVTFVIDEADPTYIANFGRPLGIAFAGEMGMTLDNITIRRDINIDAPALSLTVSSPVSNDENLTLETGEHEFPAYNGNLPSIVVAAIMQDAQIRCPYTYRFTGWSGVVESFARTVEVTLNEDSTINADYQDISVCGDACHPVRPGDIYPAGGDCQINASDFYVLAAAWLEQNGTSVIPIENAGFGATTPAHPEWINVYGSIADGQEWGRYQAGWNDDHNVGWAPGTYGQTLTWLDGSNYVENTLFPGASLDTYNNQIAYLYSGGGYSQDLPAFVSAGTYTIEFDMGRTEDNWCFFNLQLYAGSQDNVIATAQYDPTDGGNDPDLSNGYGLVDVPAHGWSHQTVTLVIDETNPNIGSPLGIGFAGDRGVTVDNISLSIDRSAADIYPASGDDIVDIDDLAELAAWWLDCTSPECLN